MPVSFEEFQGSPSETLTAQGWTAMRRVKVAWNDRQEFVEQVYRTDYPVLTIPRLICTSVTLAPFEGKNTGSGDTSSYEFAVASLQYTSPSFEFPTGQIDVETFTESIEPTAEFLTGTNKNLRWNGANSGKLVERDETPGRLFIGLDYVYAVENLRDLPDGIRDLIGRVNDKEIQPRSPGMNQFKFEPETLLFNPPSIARKFNEFGQARWNLVYRFTYKPNWDDTVEPAEARGWNYYWRVDKASGIGKFDRMFIDGGDEYTQYKPADFTGSGIFR